MPSGNQTGQNNGHGHGHEGHSPNLTEPKKSHKPIPSDIYKMHSQTESELGRARQNSLIRSPQPKMWPDAAHDDTVKLQQSVFSKSKRRPVDGPPLDRRPSLVFDASAFEKMSGIQRGLMGSADQEELRQKEERRQQEEQLRQQKEQQRQKEMSERRDQVETKRRKERTKPAKKPVKTATATPTPKQDGWTQLEMMLWQWRTKASSKVTEEEFKRKARELWHRVPQLNNKPFDRRWVRNLYQQTIDPWNSSSREQLYYKDDELDDGYGGEETTQDVEQEPEPEPEHKPEPDQEMEEINADGEGQSEREEGQEEEPEQEQNDQEDSDSPHEDEPEPETKDYEKVEEYEEGVSNRFEDDYSSDEDFKMEGPPPRKSSFKPSTLTKKSYMDRVVNSKKAPSPKKRKLSDDTKGRSNRKVNNSRNSDEEESSDKNEPSKAQMRRLMVEHNRLNSPRLGIKSELPARRERKAPGEWWKAKK